MTAQSFDPDDFAVRRPPPLSLEHFSPFVPAIGAELERLRTAKTRAVAERERVRLVLAEAWPWHLDEVYVSGDRPPFRGDVCTYIERVVVSAAGDVHGFLTVSVPVWRPKMQHPRFGGRLHRAAEYLVRLRVEARGCGCEICHTDAPLELHHLNYLAFGYEIPSDVMRLCRRCHARRHRVCGYPQDAGWRDSMQWPTV